jgi:transposase
MKAEMTAQLVTDALIMAIWRRGRPDIPHDTDVYKHQNRIERCFNRLKHFRRFATRYDRRTIHFSGFAHLAAAMIWLI